MLSTFVLKLSTTTLQEVLCFREEFVRVSHWLTLFDALRKNDVDLAREFLMSPERAEAANFLTPTSLSK